MKKWLRRFAVGSLAGLILFTAVTIGRLQYAEYQIDQDKQTISNNSPLEMGETSKLEILPLYEKSGPDGLQIGHGVSYLIRTDNATVLFDMGNNMTAASPSPLEENMQSLGISMSEIDAIVISHRHPDHVGGQNWWTEKTFSLDGMKQPSLGDISVYIPEAMTYPGIEPTLAKGPTMLADGIATTGIISFAQPFPIWLATPRGDEQALAVNIAGKGIVIITGCGHMGLEALLARAKSTFDAPVVGVVGGLHYGNADMASLQKEVGLVSSIDPIVVALSPHDSSKTVLDGFAHEFQNSYQFISVGTPLVLQETDPAP